MFLRQPLDWSLSPGQPLVRPGQVWTGLGSYGSGLLVNFDKGVFSGGFRPHLELLGHDGHVHVPTFGAVSHALVPKLTC